MSASTRPRVDYIDLAKGFCILLVIIFHLTETYKYPCVFNNVGKVFRMPLYFFLSGLFFKTYSGIWDFIKRKINKLLIPFTFWYLVGVGLSIVMYFFFGWKLSGSHRYEPIPALLQVFHYDSVPNLPVWFLISLFESNVIFYVISLIANRFGRYRIGAIVTMSLMCGAIAIVVKGTDISLPLFLYNTLYHFPSFCLGYLAFRNTKILEPNKYDKYNWIISIAAFALMTAIAHWGMGLTEPGSKIDSTSEILMSYPDAWLGIAGILFLSKSIKRLPVVSLYGRYSIMLLVTHLLVVAIIYFPLKRLGIPKIYSFIINSMITFTYGLVAIPFMRRFMPHVTAQKDVIKVE